MDTRLPSANEPPVAINENLAFAFDAREKECTGQINTYYLKWMRGVHDATMRDAVVIQALANRCPPQPLTRIRVIRAHDAHASLVAENVFFAYIFVDVLDGHPSVLHGQLVNSDSLYIAEHQSAAQRVGETCTMPNPWTGVGNPYTRAEVVDRLRATLDRGEPIIAGGAGTGISAKFLEKGGIDLIIIYNSGRFRMSGHGSTAGLMAYCDANAVAMEIGEYEVLPVVEETPVICGVHATDPRRRMWHWLGRVKEMGFSGVNNFPTHCIVDGQFRQILEETGMSVQKEVETIALARKMDLFTIVYVGNPDEATAMADAGADVVIAHVGTTVGGAIGVKEASCSLDEAARRTQEIATAAIATRNDVICLSHGGPISTPEDAAYINEHTDAVGFVGASSLERLAFERPLTELTQEFKRIPVRRKM